MPIDKAQTRIAKTRTLIDKSDLSIASRLDPVDNPLVVIDSQRTFIDSGDLVIFSQSNPIDNGDDSIAKAFNPLHGADNLIVERRKRVAVLRGPGAKRDGRVCTAKLLIAKVGMSIAARRKPVAMRLRDFHASRSIGASATNVVGGQFMEVGGHWVALLMTLGTEPKSRKFVEHNIRGRAALSDEVSDIKAADFIR